MQASQDEDSSQICPICGKSQCSEPRYPRYLCRDCAAQASDESGRHLQFFNVSFSGGFQAAYADTGEPRKSHVCFIRGVRCWADEARFGGIVIQTTSKHKMQPSSPKHLQRTTPCVTARFQLSTKTCGTINYPDIEQIARRLKSEPDPAFTRLNRLAQSAVTRGFFLKSEFLAICRWKSARKIGLCSSNSEDHIKEVTSKAFSSHDERSRIEALVELEGVAVPTASALLSVSNPKQYGVIDIRVWVYLHKNGHLKNNPKGVSLSVDNWLEYIAILRNVASRIKSTPRLVEIALFTAHRDESDSNLYS